ncbi:MAG TPA: hypothetical protein VGC59_06445 [Solirubrobacteraceae bacterium]
MRRLLLAALAAALVAPGRAEAAAPIMPLADVQAGARCTGLTVVRGTEVTSFDVEVVDVIGAERPRTARILVRVSGPAVDATGLGPGFSGSPVLCPGADGVDRTIGAISETVGEYGGRTAIATPIEAILAQPPEPSAAVPAAVPSARALAAPLTIAGLRPSLADSFTRAARNAGHVLLSSPAGPRVTFAPQPLVPGSAVTVGVTSGDISIGALGTVAYVDGPTVWMFGHPMDGAGRRALFLQDAYVHAVINNPIAVPDVSTYKLSSPGNDVGTITSDGPSAVVGRLGGLPPNFPLRVTARDLSSGRVTSNLTRIADEGDVGLPAGVSPLGLAAAAAVADAAGNVLAGAPARQSGDMCVTVTLRELRAPLHFCNRYAVDGQVPNALAGAAVADMSAAVGTLDGYRFGTLHPTAVDVGLRARAGLDQAFITGATALHRVRRGRALPVLLHLRHTGTGARSTQTIRVRVPLDTPRGLRTLRLRGTPADIGGDPNNPGDLSIVFEPQDTGDDPGPRSLDELRAAFAALHHSDAVSATFGGGSRRDVYRDPRLRITGQARLHVIVHP